MDEFNTRLTEACSKICSLIRERKLTPKRVGDTVDVFATPPTGEEKIGRIVIKENATTVHLAGRCDFECFTELQLRHIFDAAMDVGRLDRKQEKDMMLRSIEHAIEGL